MEYIEYDKKDYKKVYIDINNYKDNLEECSKNYSDFLAHYFVRKGGVINGFLFRHVGGF